jgi:hypothetical protein
MAELKVRTHMANISYSAGITAYLDREIAQRGMSPISGNVSAGVSITIIAEFAYWLRRYWWQSALFVVGVSGIIASFLLTQLVKWIALVSGMTLVVIVATVFIMLTRRGFGPLGAIAPTKKENGLAHLDVQLDRLQQLREWLKDDNLRLLIDSAIGERVQASERRQQRVTAFWSIGGILAGWLLSLVGSPASLFK